MKKIKPFKSLWSIILLDIPKAVAKWFAEDMADEYTSSAEVAFLKTLAGAVLFMFVLFGLAIIAGTKGVALMFSATAIIAFDTLRFFGRLLLIEEQSEDE